MLSVFFFGVLDNIIMMVHVIWLDNDNRRAVNCVGPYMRDERWIFLADMPNYVTMNSHVDSTFEFPCTQCAP